MKVEEATRECPDISSLPLYFQLDVIPTLTFGDLEATPLAWGGFSVKVRPAGKPRQMPQPFKIAESGPPHDAVMRRCAESALASNEDMRRETPE